MPMMQRIHSLLVSRKRYVHLFLPLSRMQNFIQKRDFDAKYRHLFNSELSENVDTDTSSSKDQLKFDNDDEMRYTQISELMKLSLFPFSDEELLIKDPDRKSLFDDLDSPTKSDQAGLREKKAHVQKVTDSSNHIVCNLPLLQIFFCTRTHSQISQFIGEIQKTKYVDQLRLVALGSRQVQIS